MGKGTATVWAWMGGLATVHPLMLAESRALTEAAAAVCTAVGLLPRVYPQVGREVTALDEGSATVWAAVGPLPEVEGPVLVEGRGLAEALATIRAAEGLHPHVRVQVLQQSGVPSKTLPAHVATMSLVGTRDRERGTELGTALGGLLQSIRVPSRKAFDTCRKDLLCGQGSFAFSLPVLVSGI